VFHIVREGTSLSIEADSSSVGKHMYELKKVEAAEDWRELHAIRRAVLFPPNQHRFEYNENHPDDCAEGNVPYLLLLDGAPIGVVRLDKRGSLGGYDWLPSDQSGSGKGMAGS
jgi:hypothetical protein